MTRPYRIAPDGQSITCETCDRTSHDLDDVYFRCCSTCGMLGPEIRQRWNGPAARALLVQHTKNLGRHKRIVAEETGVTYRVPTEWILTEGIRGDALAHFPRWDEEPCQ